LVGCFVVGAEQSQSVAWRGIGQFNKGGIDMLRRQGVLFLAVIIVLAIVGLAAILIGSRKPPADTPASRTGLPNATYTASPVTTLAQAPSATPAPQFGPITFGTGLQGERILGAGYTFPAGTAEVYAVWSYQGMASGMPYQASWFLNNNLWSDEWLTWDTSRYGSDGAACITQVAEHDADGLPPGNCRLALAIGERQVQTATFVVLGSAPTPTATPPLSVPAGALLIVHGVRALHLRDGPSLSAQVLDNMLEDTVVEVLYPAVWDGERFWYYVQVLDSTRVGWASGRHLASLETGPPPTPAPREEVMVVLGVHALHLRDGPRLSAQVLGYLEKGEAVEVLAAPVWDGERFWYNVQALDSAEIGWASGRYLVPWR